MVIFVKTSVTSNFKGLVGNSIYYMMSLAMLVYVSLLKNPLFENKHFVCHLRLLQKNPWVFTTIDHWTPHGNLDLHAKMCMSLHDHHLRLWHST